MQTTSHTATAASGRTTSESSGSGRSSSRPSIQPTLGPSGRGQARQCLDRDVAALGRCSALDDPAARGRIAGPGRRLDRAQLAAGRAAQVGGRRRERVLLLRALGVAPGGRGERRGGRAAGLRARRAGAARRRGGVRACRRRVPRHARLRRGASRCGGRQRPARARRRQARHRRGRSGPPALASGSAPRVGGEGGRRLPALGLGRHGLERPVGGRARTGLDVAAGRGVSRRSSLRSGSHTFSR